MSEFLLLNDVVRTAKSPDDVLLSFLESTSKKTKTRAKLSLFVVFVSAVFWLIQGFTLYYEMGVPRALPIIVVIIAFIISLGYRRRKPVLWKQYRDKTTFFPRSKTRSVKCPKIQVCKLLSNLCSLYFSIICFHYYSIIIHFFCFRIYKNR
jgi:hypothetical protein